jgi:16S rRNA (adenine1518-N6/adenine1519-N6)-dimethyltransferase
LSPERATDASVVRSRLAELGVRPQKRFGQNFLVDSHVVDEIRDRIQSHSPDIVVEIGPGLGALTETVVGIAGRMIAVEIDPRMAESLAIRLQASPHFEVRVGDVLGFDFSAEFAGQKVLVLGSLPYRITSPILKHLVDHRAVISEACLITQWEVADKIACSPGKQGSALGVFVQAFASVSEPRRIRRGAFFPVPEVDSAYWELSFLERARFSSDERNFFRVVRALYGHRRKMVRGALKDLLPVDAIAGVLAQAGIDGSVRGETLSMDSLNRLSLASAPFLSQDHLQMKGAA